MAQTWKSETSADITCEHCKSVYSVILHRLPSKDSDYFNCSTCGKLLQKWSDTRVPEFTLKQKADKS
jgi:predicted Zn finger-like uncharacterized protein